MPILTEAEDARYREITADCPEGKPVVWRIQRVRSVDLFKAARRVALLGLSMDKADKHADATEAEHIRRFVEREEREPTEAEREDLQARIGMSRLREEDVAKLSSGLEAFVVAGVVDARELDGEWEGVRVTMNGSPGTLPIGAMPPDTVTTLATAIRKFSTGGLVAPGSFRKQGGGGTGGRDGDAVLRIAEPDPGVEPVGADVEPRVHAGGDR